MSKESIMMIYGANNIRYEKCELFNDFVQSLLMLAFDTYMGDDVTDIDDLLDIFKILIGFNLGASVSVSIK